MKFKKEQFDILGPLLLSSRESGDNTDFKTEWIKRFML